MITKSHSLREQKKNVFAAKTFVLTANTYSSGGILLEQHHFFNALE